MSIGNLAVDLLRGPLGGQGGQGAPPPSGGPPTAPGAAPGAPGGPSSGAPSPSTQSPQDLAQLYMQLEGRARSADAINHGLALMAAANSTPSMARAIMGSVPQQQDPGSQLQTLMQLQNNAYIQQQRQIMSSPQVAQGLADQLHVPLATAQAIIASGKYGDIEATLGGVGGDPRMQEMMQARRAFQQTNPGQPLPEYLTSIDLYNLHNTQQQQFTKNVDADQQNFTGAKHSYDNMIKDATELMNSPGLAGMVGAKNQYNTAGNPMNSDATSKALGLYNKVMAGQYVSGVQDFHGAGRITNQELNQDAPSQSVMKNRNLELPTYQQGIQAYIDNLKFKRAQLFGMSGQLGSSDLSDYEYDNLVSPIYKPGGAQYVPGQAAREKPDTSVRNPGDELKLPHGRAFVIPGNGGIGYAP